MTRPVYFVLSTHWDREWREPFQGLRFDLVRLMDHVIDGLLAGHLQTPFTLDGTSAPVDDYLEIRPERRPEVEDLARRGLLDIGPWYTLPDEFLPSGESLVRNLELGHARARAYGAEPSRAGYVCDMFGHNSQLPQLFAGFGIEAAFIWRGINLVGQRNVVWTGADGTTIPAHRFGPHGYSSYAVTVRRGTDYSFGPLDATRLDEYLKAEAAATDVTPILLLDTSDHQDWDEDAYRLLLEVMAKHPEYELVHSTLDSYAAALSADASAIRATVEGELREPGLHATVADPNGLAGDSQWIIPGVASSRVYLKQHYAQAEASLLRWAEPFSFLAGALTGASYAPGFLDLAWRGLIENQTHDSICGCSIDEVHRDMEYRSDQALAIGRKIQYDALNRLAASIEGTVEEDELRLTLFNPAPRSSSGVVEVDLPLPRTWPKFQEFFGYEAKLGFRLFDGDREIPYQRIAQHPDQRRPRIRPTRFFEAVSFDVVTVALELDVPALGYRTLDVKPATPDEPYTRHPANRGLATSDRSMSNGLLSVTIEANGTLTIEDLRNGAVYHRLLTLEDSADIGDGWYHGPPVNDEVVTSVSCPADVALVTDGPLLSAFRVRTTLHVPSSFDSGSHRRSATTVPLVVETTVTMRRESPEVEVSADLLNVAADHRLRVLLPTMAKAESYLADSPFDVVERSIALRDDNFRYRELETETKPQQSWTAVFDGARGLAVVAPGLHETAIRDFPERPIALTLYRSTERTAFVYRQPEGQMLNRRLQFRFRIVPLATIPDRVRLTELADSMLAPVTSVVLDAEDQQIFRGPNSLLSRASLVELRGDLVLVSMRSRPGNRLVVRLLNPTDAQVSGALRVDLGPASALRLDQAWPTDLRERPVGNPIAADGDGWLPLTLRAKEIKTTCIALSATSRSNG